MKKIFYNEDNLKRKDINNIIKRAKILIVNSNNEVLLGYGHDTYQIIGGHVEENETYEECIVREVQEETGIILKEENRTPFLQIKYFCKDYPSKNLNSEYIINYYYIKTNDKPNIDNIQLTENEKEGMFELKYLKLDNIIEELNKNLKISNKKNTVRDTIEAVIEFLKIYNYK